MTRLSPAQRKVQNEVAAYSSRQCVGYQIPILEIPSIVRAGVDAYPAGPDAWQAAVRAKIEAVGVRTC